MGCVSSSRATLLLMRQKQFCRNASARCTLSSQEGIERFRGTNARGVAEFGSLLQLHTFALYHAWLPCNPALCFLNTRSKAVSIMPVNRVSAGCGRFFCASPQGILAGSARVGVGFLLGSHTIIRQRDFVRYSSGTYIPRMSDHDSMSKSDVEQTICYRIRCVTQSVFKYIKINIFYRLLFEFAVYLTQIDQDH